LSELSRRNLCAYVHAGAGYGESTQDHVFSGAAGIYEVGQALEENERFQLDSSLTIADIDIERIDNARADSNAYSGSNSRFTVIPMGSLNTADLEDDFYRFIEPHPFTPFGQVEDICREAVDIQVNALARRLTHINCQTAVIGISGGLDSTLALLSTVLTFDRLGWSRDRILGITMPGYGTTSRTRNNASELMEALGITSREISIAAACDQHFSDINQDPTVHDAAYENSQARERTQILMDVANQTGGIVIGTGDLSELALGWATYNGDHMSMYGLNADIPKTMVRSMVEWIAENRLFKVKSILMDIIDTPISPELLPAAETGEIKQVTEDLVGPYELHDFFLYHFMKHGYSPKKIYFLARKALPYYSDKTIKKWLKTFIRRFFSQQFKRSCLPDGPQVVSVSLSPRGGWSMPSDAYSDSFLESI
jgi:NAD+ synthase (glutamine-hydrolysing)